MAERNPGRVALLAVDAGVRAGLAAYGRDGRLRWYRSRNYGSMSRLKRAAHAIIAEHAGMDRVVVEGGGPAAEPWLKESERHGIPCVRVQAESWREVLLLSRDRRTGADAKDRAGALARQVIEWSGARRPTSLRHDAAEAILIGLWAVVRAGWLESVPDEVRRG